MTRRDKPGPARRSSPSSAISVESPTSELLERARKGNSGAIDLLYRRYLPRFQRWARCRVPLSVRDTMETGDLVQETLTRSMKHIERFVPEHPGAFLDYLRTIARNRIVDEVRRKNRRPTAVASSDSAVDPHPTPLESALGRETLERYERALARLPTTDRAAVTARIELGLTYQEIAAELELSSPDAARVRVSRAVRRLAEELAVER